MTVLDDVVVVASASGSPGVTTLCIAWGAAAGGGVLVVEADPAGGAAAAYANLSWSPGLGTLAAATWGDLDATLLAEHTQTTTLGVRVMPGPGTAAEATSALVSLGGRLEGGLCGAGPVIVDAGRLFPASPIAGLAQHAGLLVLVVAQQPESPAGTAAAVAKTRGLAAWAAQAGQDHVAVVVVGDRPYAAGEVAEVVGVPALGVIPFDHRGATRVGVGGGRRSGLVSAAAATWAAARTALISFTQPPTSAAPRGPTDNVGDPAVVVFGDGRA